MLSEQEGAKVVPKGLLLGNAPWVVLWRTFGSGKAPKVDWGGLSPRKRHPRWPIGYFGFEKALRVVYGVLSVQEAPWVVHRGFKFRQSTLGGLWSAFGSGGHPGWSMECFRFRRAPWVSMECIWCDKA